MSPAAAATDGRIRELRGLRAGARVPAGRGRHPAVAARAAVPQAHRRGLRRRGGIRRRALRGREAEAPPRNSWGRSPMSSSSTTRGPSTSLMRSSRQVSCACDARSSVSLLRSEVFGFSGVQLFLST